MGSIVLLVRVSDALFLLFLFPLLFSSSSEPYKVPSVCRRLAVGEGSDCIRLNQSVELN